MTFPGVARDPIRSVAYVSIPGSDLTPPVSAVRGL